MHSLPTLNRLITDPDLSRRIGANHVARRELRAYAGDCRLSDEGVSVPDIEHRSHPDPVHAAFIHDDEVMLRVDVQDAPADVL